MTTEKKQPVGPVTVPPPEQPELFPGFQKEYEQLGLEQYKAQQRLAEANIARAKLGPAGLSPFMGRLVGFEPPAAGPWFGREPYEERFAEAQAQALQDYKLAAQDVKSYEWRQEVMATAEGYLVNPKFKVQSAKDLLNYVSIDTYRDDDFPWLEQIYERLKYLTNILPEGFDGDAMEAQSKVYNELLTAPKLELRAVHNLTVDEIAKSFMFGVAALPQNVSNDDVRAILSRNDLIKEELKSQEDWLRDRAVSWQVETARLNLLLSGAVLATAPTLTPLEFTKLLAVQPMMGIGMLYEKYASIIQQPLMAASIANLPPWAAGAGAGFAGGLFAGAIGGAAIGAFGGPIGMGAGALIGGAIGALGTGVTFALTDGTRSKDITELYGFYRSMGEGSWSAYNLAWDAWDAPWYTKILLEGAYDPINWIGLGAATAISNKVGIGLTKIGLRTIGTRIGPWVGAVEYGYQSMADEVFKGLVRGVLVPIKGAFWVAEGVPGLVTKGSFGGFTKAGFSIPKTATMLSTQFAQSAYMDLSSTLARAHPDVTQVPKGLTGKDISDTIANNIDQFMARPTEGWDLTVRSGAKLSEINYLDDIASSKLLKGIADDVVFDNPRLAHLNEEILNMFSGQGEKVTAGKILSQLAPEQYTDDAVNKLATKLATFKTASADAAKAAFKGDTAKEVLDVMSNRLKTIRYDNITGPLTPHFIQAGRSVGWVSRVADKLLYHTHLVMLERRAVAGMARYNLLFANLGPYNYAENIQRSFLGGGDMFYPKGFDIEHAANVLGGVSNDWYDAVLYAKGEAKRLTQAVVNPKTGQTEVFKGGKIPFVDRPVDIPAWMPKVGGKRIAKSFTFFGKKYQIASVLDYNDMWSDFIFKQNRYDQLHHWLKAMQEMYPDEYGMVVGAADKYKHLLDGVESLSKAEANDVHRTLTELGFRSPEAQRAMANIDVLTFQRRLIAKDFWKTADRCTEIPKFAKEMMLDEILDGSMFAKGIDNSMEAMMEAIREAQIISLKPQIDAMTARVDDMIAHPPANLRDFTMDLNEVTDMMSITKEQIHNYRKLTELRKAKLSPADFDDFEVGSAKLLAEFMETSEEQLTKIMNQLVENARVLSTDIMDWSRVTFEGLSDDAVRAIKVGIDDLPTEIKFRIKTFKLNRELKKRNLRARYMPETNTIEFASPSMIWTEERSILYHELAHDYWHEVMVKNPEGVQEYAKALYDDGILKEFSRDATYISHNLVVEGFAEDFARYISHPKGLPMVRPSVARFMEKNFPKARPPALSDTQLARLSDLDSISRLELENILAIRNKIAEVESVIPRTAKKARNERFWQQQRAQKATIWDEYDRNARKFESLKLRASRNFLASIDQPAFTPDFIPPVTAGLTPNHLAYLYGATGDDLYRGLTKVGQHVTITPREDFIVRTVEAADAYAAKFSKTAADIGFTDDAIGEVYDQLWRNLGIEPTTLTPDSPTIMQLEEIRQDLTRLHQAYKLPGAPAKAVPRVELIHEATGADAATIKDLYSKLPSNIPDFDAIGLEVVEGMTSRGKPTAFIAYDATDNSITISMGKVEPRLFYHEIGDLSFVRQAELGLSDDTIREYIESFVTNPKIRSTYLKAMSISPDARAAAFIELRKALARGTAPNELFADDFADYMLGNLSGDKLRYFQKRFPNEAPDLIKYRQYINSVADEVGKLPMYQKAVPVAKSELAWAKGRLEIMKRTGYQKGYLTRKELSRMQDVLEGIGVTPEDIIKLGKPETVEESLRNIGLYRQRVDEAIRGEAAPAGTPSWFTTKESAMTRARELHALAYPTYGNENVIDESMRSIFPFWCVPEDTKILTKSGWKHYKQLVIGEDVLTTNPKTLVTEWQPVQKVAEFDYDDELIVIPAKGKDIKFTPNHRWLIVNKWEETRPKIKRGYELKEVSDFIPRALPHRFPTESILSPRLATILGWVVTEGYLNSPKTQRPFFIIYQSRYNYIDEIEAATGTKAKPRSKDNDPDNMVIRVSADDSAEILKVYSGKDSLPALISQISREAAEDMFRAMMLGEGNFDSAYNELAIDKWFQQPGPVSDAFQMLSILLGKAITVSKRSNQNLEMVYFINNRQPYQSKQCRRMRKEHYTGKVWCPVTTNGTWFANFNGCILPTGNTYELFRWRWLPRTLLRTPGTFAGLARWMNYTDQGNVPVPFTDLQLNPTRGTVWMGGLRSLYLRDFPEYYDKFPGMEFLDYIGRVGFFPGISVGLPMVLFGAATGKPEFAEIAPPFVRTTFSALRAISPEHIGKVLDIIYPDRFRDYMTMLTLGEEGYDADLIWRKRQSGEKLTPEEEKLWLDATAWAEGAKFDIGNKRYRILGIKGILMQQTGLFRIRPEEYTTLRQEMRLAIEESTGVPVAIQEQIDQQYPTTGKRFSDYYNLDILQTKLLYEFETYRRYQGVTTPLYPAGWQQLDIRTADYYEAIEKIYEDARHTGTYKGGELVRPSMVEINRQLVTGEIGPDQWKAARSDIQGSLAEAVRILGESPAYKDVPKTFEERAKLLEERGVVTPTQTPDQELLYYYYELEPKLTYNWESDRMELDFDTYYAYIDILLESLDAAHRERFLQRVQSEWTPMEKLYWQTSREYLRPYRNLRNIVLNEYTPEQVKQIRRYEVARGTEREELQNVIGPEGEKLIAGFSRRLREARQRLRLLDSELDAWLVFWGQTDTVMSKKGAEVYENLRKQYLTSTMVK